MTGTSREGGGGDWGVCVVGLARNRTPSPAEGVVSSRCNPVSISKQRAEKKKIYVFALLPSETHHLRHTNHLGHCVTVPSPSKKKSDIFVSHLVLHLGGYPSFPLPTHPISLHPRPPSIPVQNLSHKKKKQLNSFSSGGGVCATGAKCKSLLLRKRSPLVRTEYPYLGQEETPSLGMNRLK